MSTLPQGSNPGSSSHNESSDLTFSSDSIESVGRPLTQEQLIQLQQDRSTGSHHLDRKAAFQWPTSPLRASSSPQQPTPDETEELDPRNDVEQSGEAVAEDVELQEADADASLVSLVKEPQQSLFASPDAISKDGFDLTAAPPMLLNPSKLARAWSTTNALRSGAAGRPDMKRSSTTWTHRPVTPENEPNMSHISFLPMALAQTVQIPLNLLRSLIPHPLLDSPAPESLSASAMQVPVASLGALLEACQALDWISKRTLNLMGDATGSTMPSGKASFSAGGASARTPFDPTSNSHDFDLFDVIQKVADLVGGIAAAKGIDLVVGLQPEISIPSDLSCLGSMLECSVWSEPEALKFLFMSCLANVIQSATPHSMLEIDFGVQRLARSVVKPNGQPDVSHLRCTIGFTLTPPMSADIEDEQRDALKDEFIAALVDSIGGTLQTEFRSAIRTMGPDKAPLRATTSLRHEISISIGQGQASDVLSGPSPEKRGITAPTTKDLVDFASKLSGQKVAFHAQRHSPFAEQLTNLLTKLGCQVSYVGLNTQNVSSPGSNDDLPGPQVKTAVALTNGRPALVSYTSDIGDIGGESQSVNASASSTEPGTSLADDTAVLDPVTGVPVTFVNRMPVGTPSTSQDDATGARGSGRASPQSNGPPGARVEPFNFVIIDDDIVTLQELLRLRSAVPMLRSSLDASRQAKGLGADGSGRPSRPTLDHRTKSSPQIERIMGQHLEMLQSLGAVANSMAEKQEEVSQVIIFFTSLRSYRLVRDTVQPIIDSVSFSGGAPPPEVMVLPKPAGLRRILTALYAAEHKPVVDAPFLPIATSPVSPSVVRARSWWDSEKGGNGSQMTLTQRQSNLRSPSASWSPWSPAASLRSDELAPFPDAHLADSLSANLDHGAPCMDEGGRNLSQDTAIPANKLGPRIELVHKDLLGVTNAAPSAGGAGSRSTKTEADGSRLASTSASASVSGQPSNPSNHTARFHKASTQHSPLPPDALEYFSETAAKMGGSGASGMMIQSPDGRPAGIFFQPKSSSSVSSYTPNTPGLFRRTNSTTIATGVGGGGGSSGQDAIGAAEQNSSGRSSGQKEGLSRSTSQGPSGHVRPGTEADEASGTHGNRPRASSSRSSMSTGLLNASQSSATSSRYPNGSIFAPQVGIQSVLSGSQLPMATPLSSSSSIVVPGSNGQAKTPRTPTLTKASTDTGMLPEQPQQPDNAAKPRAAPKQTKTASSKGQGAAKTGTTKRVSASPTKKTAAGAAASSTLTSPSAAGTPPRKKVVKAASLKSTNSLATEVAQATPPTTLTTTLTDAKQFQQGSAPSSPVVGTSATGGGLARTATSKLAARQTFAAAPSPSDSKKRPSAQPQSGFMIGMGFAPTARRGTGPKKAPVREAVLPPIKVLIVEDNPINQRILSMFMSRQKIKYDVANNGREAVDKWQTGGFHLILMDIQLPVMDGIEATKEIRKLERSTNIGILPITPPASSIHSSSNASASTGTSSRRSLVPPSFNLSPFRAQVIIVALTASVLSSDRVEALAAGCNDFLNKPVSLPWLNQKILEWGSMMYLMYSCLSDEGPTAVNQKDAASKVQVHLGFGYGPAEKAKALASNLHIGAGGIGKKKPIIEAGPTADKIDPGVVNEETSKAAAVSEAGQGPAAPSPTVAAAPSVTIVPSAEQAKSTEVERDVQQPLAEPPTSQPDEAAESTINTNTRSDDPQASTEGTT